MPQITAAAILQIALLLSALPAQYLISKWSGSDTVQRHRATQRLIGAWKDLRKSYLNLTVWTDWLDQWINSLIFSDEPGDDDQGESPALEIQMHDNDQGYFGASREVRSPRPPYVLHRVGQVVMEKRNHMVGVIVSWDDRLRAPPEWIKKMYSGFEVQKAMDTPHYKVIFSGPGSSSFLVGYLPQASLELFTGFKPDIPTLERYFSHHDGTRFVMQPWLQERFPED
ncbi:uncharacterized protein si:dkey-261l7.2 [Anguilla anguilla]|uniref:Hemimethylated DNA-binding domain-containing protein n=1 Tax=Anguilla anguilla TaxID=7936 RepID=A0A9D3MCJ3_ANGAN|nr:uncharacterized protein si:dkey-261l7.2 [Anguilla anguilla]XP_035276069.1 uncharacterized protein si:dkey-261l7.2 [Anguilla anguilla]KAG5846454.1 hypothetical protein ANANG_G00115130 [Anguilla anguilla]